MFAVVYYKYMDLRGVIPIRWIYNFDEKKSTTSTSYISFYSNDMKEVAPEKCPEHIHSNDVKTKVPGKFYKINIEKRFDSQQQATDYQATQRMRKRTSKCISETDESDRKKRKNEVQQKKKSANAVKLQKEKLRSTQNSFYLKNLQVKILTSISNIYQNFYLNSNFRILRSLRTRKNVTNP